MDKNFTGVDVDNHGVTREYVDGVLIFEFHPDGTSYSYVYDDSDRLKEKIHDYVYHRITFTYEYDDANKTVTETKSYSDGRLPDQIKTYNL